MRQFFSSYFSLSFIFSCATLSKCKYYALDTGVVHTRFEWRIAMARQHAARESIGLSDYWSSVWCLLLLARHIFAHKSRNRELRCTLYILAVWLWRLLSAVHSDTHTNTPHLPHSPIVRCADCLLWMAWHVCLCVWPMRVFRKLYYNELVAIQYQNHIKNKITKENK